MISRQYLIRTTQATCHIHNYLAAQEPATLPEICKDLQVQMGLQPWEVLPVVIDGLAAMQRDGKIRAYDQCPFPGEDPMDYAWELNHDK